MPEEFSRTTKRKRVVFPGGDPGDPNAAGVNIPVITAISFIDPVNRAQEYQYSIDNSARGDRAVHVDNVYPDGDTAAQPLLVERIDKWRIVDPVARGQESEVSFDNRTGADTTPPRFTQHARTHVVRYKNDPDDGNWIDAELIDQLDFVDPVDRGQETIVTLLNPVGTIDDDGKEVLVASTDDPEISDTANSIDPAWRTDPFQNIIDWSAGIYVLIRFNWTDCVTSNLGERCSQISNTPGSFAWTTTGGVQSKVYPVPEIDVQCIEDQTGTAATTDSRLVNTPEIVIEELNALGYPIFFSCQVCGTSTVGGGDLQASINYPPLDPAGAHPGEDIPPGCPNDPGYADPVPYNSYSKAFLFDISPTNATIDDTAINPTTVNFEISGIPNPRPWFYHVRTLPIFPSFPHPIDPLDDPTEEYITNGTSGFRFDVYVFDKSAVDVYEYDEAFPVRKKGIADPEAEDAVEQTRAVAKTKTIDETHSWVDANHHLHEGYSDAEPDTGATGTAGTGSTGSDVYNLEFQFETFTIGPGIPVFPGTQIEVDRPICWPSSPPLIVQGLLDNDPHVPPNVGDLHVRRYSYRWKVNGHDQTLPNDILEFDFGTPPDEPST